MKIRSERADNGVIVITFDDPERRNAMTAALGDELAEVIGPIRDDPEVRAVVLTGAPPAFSAGGDLDMLDGLARRARDESFDATDTMHAFYRRFLAVRDLPVPTIAAINGAAVGAGLCVALACDLRIAAEDAKLGLNFSRLGLHPGMGATWFLPRIVGPMRAAELLFTGRLFDGIEAAAFGLALDAVAADEVLSTAVALADQIAQASPLVVRQLKQTLAAADGERLDEALVREASTQAISYASDDFAEGIAAARERRAPRFDGN